MDFYQIFFIVALALAGFGLLSYIVITFIVGRIIYSHLLERNKKYHWGRECSAPNDYETHMMWDEGLIWGKENLEYKKDVSIENEGYKLYGEYYDYGYSKAVIIIPGRMESLCYSYYFAPALKKAGFNLLLIDKRSHGLSEGKYEDGGYKSHTDIIKWAKLLNEQFNMNSITLFGICIGSSTCMYTITDKNCPKYVDRIITDGMFSTFAKSLRLHLKDQRRPTFPFTYTILFWARVLSKANMVTKGPIKQVGKLDRPILMLYTKEDKFSTMDQAKELFDKCSSKEKEIVYFDHGAHSRIYYHNKEKYEQTIIDFVNKTDR